VAVRLLLDTNAWSAMRTGDERVASAIRDSEELLLSVVVIGELLQGFRLGTREAENRHDLERFSAAPFVRVLPVTARTAERYGALWATLRRAGTPIPTNDVWIASQGIEEGARLASFDEQFRHVPALDWWNPGSRPPQ
jgi:tRNA(fMet)-specific endonuclease VapC